MNPSFWPSVWMLNGWHWRWQEFLWRSVASSRSKKYDRAQRAVIIRWGAYFLLPLAFMPLLAGWYFSTVPAPARDLALGGAVAMSFIFAFGVVPVFCWRFTPFSECGPVLADINLETALLMAAIAFIATASMEFVREGIRKPYVLMDIMYSNGILKTDLPRLNEEGLLSQYAMDRAGYHDLYPRAGGRRGSVPCTVPALSRGRRL